MLSQLASRQFEPWLSFFLNDISGLHRVSIDFNEGVGIFSFRFFQTSQPVFLGFALCSELCFLPVFCTTRSRWGCVPLLQGGTASLVCHNVSSSDIPEEGNVRLRMFVQIAIRPVELCHSLFNERSPTHFLHLVLFGYPEQTAAVY